MRQFVDREEAIRAGGAGVAELPIANVRDDTPFPMVPKVKRNPKDSKRFAIDYLCPSCDKQLMSESWDEKRCFGSWSAVSDHNGNRVYEGFRYCPFCGTKIWNKDDDSELRGEESK